MACLVDSDTAFLLLSHDLGLFLQTANDTVHSIEEVLFTYLLTVMTGSYQSSLIADISNVGARKTWGLACQKVDVDSLVYLQWFQMHHEYFLTLIQVRQVYVDLTIETTSTEQGGIQHVGTVGSS